MTIIIINPIYGFYLEAIKKQFVYHSQLSVQSLTAVIPESWCDSFFVIPLCLYQTTLSIIFIFDL